jgi:hypothetical protein
MHIRLNTKAVAKWAKSIKISMTTVKNSPLAAYVMALYKTARETEKKKKCPKKNPRKNFTAPFITINNPALSPNFG